MGIELQVLAIRTAATRRKSNNDIPVGNSNTRYLILHYLLVFIKKYNHEQDTCRMHLLYPGLLYSSAPKSWKFFFFLFFFSKVHIGRVWVIRVRVRVIITTSEGEKLP